MDDKKVCFIIPVNDEIEYYQCWLLINAIKIPNGLSIDIIPIRNASSMCEAYNIGMKSSDAKYKFYLHQDTFIVNMNLIKEVLSIFQNDESIGMIGICGAKNLPKSGIWWDSPTTVGKVFEKNGNFVYLLAFHEIDSDYEVVDAIDGLIMITQYDIEWREDIFDNWHFYDISQSFEFKKKGYNTVIPNQLSPWCMHTRGNTNMEIYELYRKKFIETYKN